MILQAADSLDVLGDFAGLGIDTSRDRQKRGELDYPAFLRFNSDNFH
jgi:hypothetical protein